MDFGGQVNRLEYFDIAGAIAIDRNNHKIYVANEMVPRINVYELINTKAEDSFMSPPAAAPTPPQASK